MISKVTKAEAVREIRLHEQDLDDFFVAVGEKEEYLGSEVLIWLGY